MVEWGRKEYSKKWPSRRPVWGWTAILLTGVFFFGVFCLDYSQGWTAAERLYLMDYLKSGARGQAGAGMQSKYTMLEGVTAKGSPVFLLGDQVERVADVNGKPGYRLTDEGVKAGLVRLEWVTGQYNDRGMHTLLGRWVFKHDDIWGYMARPFYFSLAFLVVACSWRFRRTGRGGCCTNMAAGCAGRSW